MTDRLGRMPSAPLVYVLAEVRGSPILDVATRAGAVQEAIRPKFPLLESVAEIQFNGPTAGLQTSAKIYSFTDAAKRRGVIVSSSGICYHTTQYVTSNEFFDELQWVLSAVSSICAQDLTLRLGLRYVDAIVPREGETAFSYVKPELSGVSLGGSTPNRRVQCVVEYPRPQGGLNVRFVSLGNPLYLSPDLLPWGLQKPEWAQQAEASNKPAALLDTDNWEVEQLPFNAEAIVSRFKSLKEGISEAFREVITSHAISVWNKQRD